MEPLFLDFVGRIEEDHLVHNGRVPTHFGIRIRFDNGNKVSKQYHGNMFSKSQPFSFNKELKLASNLQSQTSIITAQSKQILITIETMKSQQDETHSALNFDWNKQDETDPLLQKLWNAFQELIKFSESISNYLDSFGSSNPSFRIWSFSIVASHFTSIDVDTNNITKYLSSGNNHHVTTQSSASHSVNNNIKNPNLNKNESAKNNESNSNVIYLDDDDNDDETQEWMETNQKPIHKHFPHQLKTLQKPEQKSAFKIISQAMKKRKVAAPVLSMNKKLKK
jgi:hypothetical protein